MQPSMGEATRSDVGSLLRKIPAVDELLATPRIQGLLMAHPRWAVLEAVRQVVAERRQRVLRGEMTREAGEAMLTPEAIAEAVADRTVEKAGPSLLPVINATGVVLHTNLGRAPLAPAALQAIQATAAGYGNLELDLATGDRGSRQAHVESFLTALTGAEAALVVNNNAAAVLLAINTFANGKEIVVSRGQLVEIGDSFRIPDVMVRAGGRLREVGTTNRTHLRDYEEAIGPEAAMILRVHRSNFQILGFTADVELSELVALAGRRNLLLMDDLGSGALLDLSLLGLRKEPLAADAIRAGADLVTFSGDKLLGGPQAGILVGRRDLLARARTNPLARTVRIDKLSLAALEATLRLYREPERALREIPILRMLGLAAAAIGERAEMLAQALRPAAPGTTITIEDETSEVGGGALPLQAIPTRVLALRPAHGSAAEVEARLRRGRPPVLVRIKGDRVLLDLRTVETGDEAALLQALREALGGRAGGIA
jgi:L-seryl-tRNA(Ser) seleniumtransferase